MEPALFDRLVESVKQAKAIERGEMAPGRVTISHKSEVAAARAKLGMTQTDFAALLGVPVGTLRGWEQGRRQPQKTAQVLIRVAQKYPEQLLECV